MFREKYIKDNDLIRPDDDFLERLKVSVAQEDKIIHIGEYVDYENAEQFEKIGQENVEEHISPSIKKRNVRWKPVVAIAACLALVCTIAFVAGDTASFNDNGLQADMGTLVSEDKNEDNVTEIDEDSIEKFNQVCSLLESDNAIIYEMASYDPMQSGMSYLQESKKNGRELDIQERDELIGDILAKKYVLTNTTAEWDSEVYYMAEFENQSYVIFAIGGEYIYIAEVSGVQSMASR